MKRGQSVSLFVFQGQNYLPDQFSEPPPCRAGLVAVDFPVWVYVFSPFLKNTLRTAIHQQKKAAGPWCMNPKKPPFAHESGQTFTIFWHFFSQ
jgi:hypothetical protein